MPVLFLSDVQKVLKNIKAGYSPDIHDIPAGLLRADENECIHVYSTYCVSQFERGSATRTERSRSSWLPLNG